MDGALRRWLVRVVFLGAVAAVTAVALAGAGLSDSFAYGAAAGVWLALSLALYGSGVPGR